MMLHDALEGISQRRYYEICGYSYRCLSHGGHGNLTFDELNPTMKLGILELINGIYRVQKAVYAYDIHYLTHLMKGCGIQLKPFWKRCGFPDGFIQKYSMMRKGDIRRQRIRLELIRMINRLFAYILKKAPR